MKIRVLGVEFFHAVGRTDVHDETDSRLSPLWKSACQNANRDHGNFRTGETAMLSESKVLRYVKPTVTVGAVCCISE
jgi:hypothetical protein